jgi:hypothetical protein
MYWKRIVPGRELSSTVRMTADVPEAFDVVNPWQPRVNERGSATGALEDFGAT